MERWTYRLATVLCGSFLLGAPPTGPAPAAHAVSRDPALAAAVMDWFHGGGDTRISALQKDFEAIAQAANSTDLSGVGTGCATLVVDVDRAQQYEAFPDGQAQRYWAAALTLYAKGAADCVQGAEKVDSALLLQANDEIMQGSSELTKATERVQDILK
jgi:hypothetical protein